MSHLNKIKSIFVGLSLAIFIAGIPISAAALDGASLAQTVLLDAKVSQTDIQSNRLKDEVEQKVSILSAAERLAFVTELARAIALEERQSERKRTVYAAMALMQLSETSPAERAQAISRLFESPDPKMQKTAEGLLANLGELKLSNGAQGRDLSVYREALAERSGISQSRLVECLFRKSPVETASWFAENIELPKNERTRLLAELGTAAQVEGSASAPWEPAAGPVLNNADRERKLREWMASPSWILQLLAKSLLEKYPPWQTPEIQVAIQKQAVPPNVILRPIDPPLLPGVSNATPKAIPGARPLASPAPVTKTPTPAFERHVPVWPWLVGILALVIIIGVRFLKRRA